MKSVSIQPIFIGGNDGTEIALHIVHCKNLHPMNINQATTVIWPYAMEIVH